ncbi:MAG: hypothetical protein H6Q73_2527 [Firmicutes bacterium]|nr:hypothetical protein [Bacillota bacterium]
MKADLHIHTNCSDGVFSPEEIVLKAKTAGLKIIAITDHDTVDGLLKLSGKMQLGEEIEVIPGIEFSTDLPANEVHILGYYIDILHPELNHQLRFIAQDREKRVQKMVAKLCELGYQIKYERVLKLAQNATSVGRPHVAAALIEAGYFFSMADVFNTLLGKNMPAYVPHYKMTPAETISLITSAGGIPVLAHPGLIGDDDIVLNILKLGIQGIEVYHPSHDQVKVDQYLKLVQQNKLIATGGSDFHGFPGRIPECLGEFYVPEKLAQQLKKSIKV